MGLFTKCDGDQAVLINNGVYKQVDVYERDGLLYAAIAGGYVRLKYDGVDLASAGAARAPGDRGGPQPHAARRALP